MVGEPDIQNREPRLADYAERLGAAERDGVALHLHMGSLRAEHRQPFHNRLCHETLRPIVEQHKGALYQTISGDMGAALFVRDYLQSRGYRVALDGTNHLTLPLIGRERLGFDFIKLRWGPDYETAIVEAQRTVLAAAIERIGQARIILTGCHSARAVSAGQGLGIGMFQGAYIETMLRFEATARPKEKAEA